MARSKTWQSKMQMAGTDKVAPPSQEDMRKMMASSGAGMYAGKSLRPGGGGRFAKVKAAIMSKGMPADRASAIAAAAGREKYGAKKMAKWSAAGRKRAG